MNSIFTHSPCRQASLCDVTKSSGGGAGSPILRREHSGVSAGGSAQPGGQRPQRLHGEEKETKVMRKPSFTANSSQQQHLLHLSQRKVCSCSCGSKSLSLPLFLHINHPRWPIRRKISAVESTWRMEVKRKFCINQHSQIVCHQEWL